MEVATNHTGQVTFELSTSGWEPGSYEVVIFSVSGNVRAQTPTERSIFTLGRPHIVEFLVLMIITYFPPIHRQLYLGSREQFPSAGGSGGGCGSCSWYSAVGGGHFCGLVLLLLLQRSQVCIYK